MAFRWVVSARSQKDGLSRKDATKQTAQQHQQAVWKEDQLEYVRSANIQKHLKDSNSYATVGHNIHLCSTLL